LRLFFKIDVAFAADLLRLWTLGLLFLL